MPVNQRFAMAALKDAIAAALPPSRRVLFEYVLIAGFNDAPADADGATACIAISNLAAYYTFDDADIIGSTLRDRSDGTRHEHEADLVIQATGLDANVTDTDHALVRSLLDQGLAQVAMVVGAAGRRSLGTFGGHDVDVAHMGRTECVQHTHRGHGGIRSWA